MGSNPHEPLGICQRLINFIMNKIVRPTPLDSEIIVEFMHTDAPKNCTQTDERNTVQKGSEEKEKHQEIPAPNSHQKIGSIKIGQGKGLQEVEAITVAAAKNKGTTKSVTFKEDEKKGANNLLSADETKKANNNGSHEETKEKPPRHWGPLLSVASNINEKSDAFINRRKKAMRRNYTLDPEKS